MAEAAVKANMFVWEGTDRSGRRIKGEMSGQTDAVIKAMLRRQGINPTRVKKKPRPLLGGSSGKENHAQGHRGIQPADVHHDELRGALSPGIRDRGSRAR